MVLGYIPLNIEYEKLKIDVKDVKKVYQLLIRDQWELLMAGIFRFINKFYLFDNGNIFLLDIESFIQYYNSNFPVRNESENRLAKIENVLMSFYLDVFKDKLKEYVDKRFGVEYNSLESIVAIQREMTEIQKDIIDSGKLECMGINCSPEEGKFLSILENRNKDEKFYDDEAQLLHSTRIINYIDSILTELTIYQSEIEDDVHWGGTMLDTLKNMNMEKKYSIIFKMGIYLMFN